MFLGKVFLSTVYKFSVTHWYTNKTSAGLSSKNHWRHLSLSSQKPLKWQGFLATKWHTKSTGCNHHAGTACEDSCRPCILLYLVNEPLIASLLPLHIFKTPQITQTLYDRNCDYFSEAIWEKKRVSSTLWANKWQEKLTKKKKNKEKQRKKDF